MPQTDKLREFIDGLRDHNAHLSCGDGVVGEAVDAALSCKEAAHGHLVYSGGCWNCLREKDGGCTHPRLIIEEIPSMTGRCVLWGPRP